MDIYKDLEDMLLASLEMKSTCEETADIIKKLFEFSFVSEFFVNGSHEKFYMTLKDIYDNKDNDEQ